MCFLYSLLLDADFHYTTWPCDERIALFTVKIISRDKLQIIHTNFLYNIVFIDNTVLYFFGCLILSILVIDELGFQIRYNKVWHNAELILLIYYYFFLLCHQNLTISWSKGLYKLVWQHVTKQLYRMILIYSSRFNDWATSTIFRCCLFGLPVFIFWSFVGR